MLGEGRTGRLYQALVETELASSVDAGAPSLRDPFLFYVTATARPGVSAPKLEAAMLDEIERIKTAPITAEELARATRRIESSFAYQTESVTAQARELGYWAMVADWRYLTTYMDRIRALTPEAVQTVANRYFLADKRTVGHFVPSLAEPSPAPPVREAAARVEKPGRDARAIPIPAPSKPAPVDRRITRFTLANGITVVVQENPASPTLALRASLPAGHALDPQGKSGLASLTAAMLTRGTETRTRARVRDPARGRRREPVGERRAARHDDLGPRGEPGLRSPDGPPRGDAPAPRLPRRRAGTLEGRGAGADRPGAGRSRQRGRARVRPGDLSGGPRAPAADVRRGRGGDPARSPARTCSGSIDHQYGPDGLILVLAGNLTADQVRQAVETRLGAWPRNPQSEPPPTLDVPLQTAAVRSLIPLPDKSQTAILWGHAGGLRRSDPDFYAAQVMNLVLGGGGALNSRLGTVIRDELGLAYTVESFFDAGWYPGPFAVALGTNPANAKKAIETMLREVRRLRERGITRRERDEAVAYLTGRFPLRLETNSGMADVLWAMEFYRLGADYLDRYGDYYRAVTLAQANDAALKHLHPDRGTLVVAGTDPGAIDR